MNAFADTFYYQAALGVAAVLLALFFARGRPLTTAVRWVVEMIR